MPSHRHWSLGAKLMLVGVPFLVLVLLATAANCECRGNWRKLDVSSRVHAAVIATEHGLI